MFKLYLMLFLLLGLQAVAGAQRLLEVGDAEIGVEVHPSGGERLLLWLPSEFGLSPRVKNTASRLSEHGVEVWIPDLHTAWFIPPGRYSLNEVDPGAVALLVEAALESGRQVYLAGDGRTTVLALHAVRRLQREGKEVERLRGLITFSPRLYVRTPQGGETAEFLPIAAASNLPVYILQPIESSGIWRVGEVLEELEKGGSPAFLHRLPKVSDGFYSRSNFSDAEAETSRRLPETLVQAMALLDTQDGTPMAPAPMRGEEQAPLAARGSDLLRPYQGERQAPSLSLPTLDSGQVDLASLKGKVVMVNFWTTWCPPCVKEIPSLQRLYRATREHGLEILAVDVGETPETMRKFLADKPVDFPVLMDLDGVALKRWGVHAFPTTLVLDRQHRIRYAVFGAFEWDSPEVLETLEPLLNQSH